MSLINHYLIDDDIQSHVIKSIDCMCLGNAFQSAKSPASTEFASRRMSAAATLAGLVSSVTSSAVATDIRTVRSTLRRFVCNACTTRRYVYCKSYQSTANLLYSFVL